MVFTEYHFTFTSSQQAIKMFKVLAVCALLAGANAQLRVLNTGLGLGGLRANGLGLGAGGIALAGNGIGLAGNGLGLQRVALAAPQLIRGVAFDGGLGGGEASPEPYSFQYGTDDAQGTQTSRQETSDGRTVQGSYGYTDADGVSRIVEYVADENGYRANIRTNEPGVGRNEEIGDPADTTWDIQPTPPGVVERYLQPNFQSQRLALQAPAVRTIVAQPQPQLVRSFAVQPQLQRIAIAPQQALRTVLVGGGNAGLFNGGNAGLVNGAGFAGGLGLSRFSNLRAFSGGLVNGGLINTGLLNGGGLGGGGGFVNRGFVNGGGLVNGGFNGGLNGGGVLGGGLVNRGFVNGGGLVNGGFNGGLINGGLVNGGLAGGLGGITTTTGVLNQASTFGLRK